MFKINRVNLFLIVLLILTIWSNLSAQENEKLLPRFDYEVVSFPGRRFKMQKRMYIFGFGIRICNMLPWTLFTLLVIKSI